MSVFPAETVKQQNEQQFNRFCTNCGSQLLGGVNFCGQCGAAQASPTSVPIAATPVVGVAVAVEAVHAPTAPFGAGLTAQQQADATEMMERMRRIAVTTGGMPVLPPAGTVLPPSGWGRYAGRWESKRGNLGWCWTFCLRGVEMHIVPSDTNGNVIGTQRLHYRSFFPCAFLIPIMFLQLACPLVRDSQVSSVGSDLNFTTTQLGRRRSYTSVQTVALTSDTTAVYKPAIQQPTAMRTQLVGGWTMKAEAGTIDVDFKLCGGRFRYTLARVGPASPFGSAQGMTR